jgi:hypothetical protein
VQPDFVGNRQERELYQLAEYPQRDLVAGCPAHARLFPDSRLKQASRDPALPGHQRLEHLVPDRRGQQNELRLGNPHLVVCDLRDADHFGDVGNAQIVLRRSAASQPSQSVLRAQLTDAT